MKTYYRCRKSQLRKALPWFGDARVIECAHQICNHQPMQFDRLYLPAFWKCTGNPITYIRAVKVIREAFEESAVKRLEFWGALV